MYVFLCKYVHSLPKTMLYSGAFLPGVNLTKLLELYACSVPGDMWLCSLQHFHLLLFAAYELVLK